MLVKIRRAFIDAFGSIVAALAGVPYFLFSFGKAWDATPEVPYLLAWATLSVLAVGAVVVVLTILLRPEHLWLYPLTFSWLVLLFGFLALREEPGAAGVFWFAFGLATAAVGWGWAYLTQRMSTKLRHAKNATPISD